MGIGRPSAEGWHGLIEVENILRTTQYHRRGWEIDRFHGFEQPIRLRYLPAFGRMMFVENRPKHYRCPHSEDGQITTQRCARHNHNRSQTTAFEQDVLTHLTHGTVADVSQWLHLRVKAVESFMDHHLAPAVDWTRSPRWRPWVSTK